MSRHCCWVQKHLSDLPPINNNKLDRGLNGNHDNMVGSQTDISRSNQSNPPLRGRVGPAEEAAPAYSSIIGASTNKASESTLKNRGGKKGARQNGTDQFESDNDVNESEFASEEDGDFR